MSQSVKKYDVGLGYFGNGLTFYNRLEIVNGDFKTIAHLSDEGVFTFYDDLPNEVKETILKRL